MSGSMYKGKRISILETMPKALPAVSIVILILLSLAGIAVGINNYSEYKSQERIIHAFSPYYQGLAKQCYESDSANCCLASVSNMEAKKGILIPGTGCPTDMTQNILRCMGSYTWCEK